MMSKVYVVLIALLLLLLLLPWWLLTWLLQVLHAAMQTRYWAVGKYMLFRCLPKRGGLLSSASSMSSATSAALHSSISQQLW